MQNHCLNRKYNSGFDKYTNLMVESLIAPSTPATAEVEVHSKSTAAHSRPLTQLDTCAVQEANYFFWWCTPSSSPTAFPLQTPAPPTHSQPQLLFHWKDRIYPKRLTMSSHFHTHMPHSSTSAPFGCTSLLRNPNSPTCTPGPIPFLQLFSPLSRITNFSFLY